MFKIAIVGRPNTGKSTLFNQLTGSRAALVHDRPGVTRDVVEGEFAIDNEPFAIFDTAGLEKTKTGIGAMATEKTLAAIRDADAILFVVDGRAGLNPEDSDWAKVIKQQARDKKILLIANKMESSKRAGDVSEFYKLGFGAPITIAAEHKIGFDNIYEWIEKFAECRVQSAINKSNKIVGEADTSTVNCKLQTANLKIAIMGQPNVGKSTLVNKILGTERVLVRDEPGITRDTINIRAHALGRDFILVDTAGLRRKSGVTDDVETLAALKSLDALGKSDVIILIVDSTKNIENQALGIAARVYDAGKILCVALNKWDLVPMEERDDKLLKLKHQFNASFSQIIKPLILPISAERGTGVKNMLKRVFDLWELSNARAPTSLINRTIEKLVAAHQPPMSRLKRPMKLKFATQTSEHPIRITIHVGGASELPESYTRYLRRGLATALNWEQLPIIIEYKKTNNPYD